MKTYRWTIEHALYGLIFFIALGVRFLRLGAAPLTDFEASWALQALALAGGGQGTGSVSLGPNPGYAMITGLLFFLLGSNNSLARLWPALAGALLVFLPAFFRYELGKKAALILALGLALDPGLAAISRTTGGGMPALSFGLLALAAGYRRQAAWAGILGGLALLSGPSVLTGAVGVALVWGAARLLEKAGVLAPLRSFSLAFGSNGGERGPQAALPLEGEAPNGLPLQKTNSLRTGIYFLIGTLLIVGTLFFRFPQGLGALAETLTAYLDGWSRPSGVPALHLPLALLIYQPLPLILGVVAAVRGWMLTSPRPMLTRLLSLWALIALLLPMIYPARQVGDLIWVMVPVWALAAIELADAFALKIDPQNKLIVAGQAALLFILLAFAWNYLLVMSNANLLQGALALRSFLVLLFATAGMGVVTTVLVALGWTWPVARQGLVWGAGITLGLYMLSASWGTTQFRPAGAQELWTHLPSAGETDLLSASLSDVSQWKTGQPRMLDLVILVDSPSLRWVLRDWQKVRYGSDLSPTEMPSAIVTDKGQASPALAARYRGQDFPWQVFPAWGGLLPGDLARWLAFRDAPSQQTELILWIRADLFPGSIKEVQSGMDQAPEEDRGP